MSVLSIERRGPLRFPMQTELFSCLPTTFRTRFSGTLILDNGQRYGCILPKVQGWYMKPDLQEKKTNPKFLIGVNHVSVVLSGMGI